MNKNIFRNICFLVLLLSGCIVLYISIRNFLLGNIYSLASNVQDDSFYYIVPAFNFKSSGFFSFDGVNPTYGFQPLYMLWLSWCALWFSDLDTFFRFTLIQSAFFHVFTAITIFFIARILIGRNGKENINSYIASIVSALLGLFYLVNINIYMSNISGKENALAAFLYALMCLMVMRIYSSQQLSKRWNYENGILGILCGLLIICRILPTTIFSVGVVCAVMIWRKRANFWYWFGLLIPLILWFSYAHLAFGVYMPSSGHIKARGLLHQVNILYSTGCAKSFSMLINYLGGILKFSLGLNNFFWLPHNLTDEISRYFYNLFWLIGVVLILFAGIRKMFRATIFPFLLFMLVSSFLGYIIIFIMLYDSDAVLSNLRYYVWYIYDIPVLILCVFAVPLALGLENILAACKVLITALNKYIVAGGIAILFFGITVYVFRSFPVEKKFIVNSRKWSDVMIKAGLDIRDEIGLKNGDMVCSFNSGALGFIMPKRVVNLDGLANDNVWIFRKNGGDWGEYIKQQNLVYYCDIFVKGFMNDPSVSYNVIKKIPFRDEDYYILKLTPGKILQPELYTKEK